MEHAKHVDAQGNALDTSPSHLAKTGTRRTAWRPLRMPMFRNLLIADLVSDIGTFMQGVGAAWLMVSQGAGPLLVALTQTASALPFFLLALPAGALGDILDRRKLILATEVWMLSIATLLAALTLLRWITPWTLLLLTLALAIGDALEAPTWRAVLPELVAKEDLLPAMALNGIEFNLARAIGPGHLHGLDGGGHARLTGGNGHGRGGARGEARQVRPVHEGEQAMAVVPVFGPPDLRTQLDRPRCVIRYFEETDRDPDCEDVAARR